MSEARLDAVLALTRALLEIPSESGDEAAVAAFIEQRLAKLAPHSLVRAGNSLCVVMSPPVPDLPTVMLVGHTDTVPAFGPNPVRTAGDRLHGLGASDMKAADACILDVLERNATQPARVNLVGVLYACEEVSFDRSEMPAIRAAARPWFDRTDLAVCMEPTDNRIELGCLGTSHARVEFAGVRAHSARPWQGDNAIHKGAGVLSRLAAREPVEFTYHGLKFIEAMSATMVEFRGARNVIPDRFVLNVNYRFAPGKDEAAVRRELDDLVRGEGEVELVDFCPAGRVCGDNPVLTALVEAAGSPQVCAKQAWTDVGRLSEWGIDAINWGPGATSQAHQDDEWISIAEIARALESLDRWLFG